MLVVFATWHHIFCSEALAVNWPTALIAFWNNYAWAGVMTNLEWMQRAIDRLVGSSRLPSSTIASIESAYNVPKIYKRQASRNAISIESLVKRRIINLVARRSDSIVEKEASGDIVSAISFRGQFIKPGISLPGEHFDFAGILAKQNIPAVSAFTTALLFILVTVASNLVAVVFLVLLLIATVCFELLKDDRSAYFRAHLGVYLLLIMSRALSVSFFAKTFPAILQFSFLASTGAAALACIVLVAFLLVLGGAACYAFVFRYKHSYRVSQPDRINIGYIRIFRLILWYRLSRQSVAPLSEDKKYIESFP